MFFNCIRKQTDQVKARLFLILEHVHSFCHSQAQHCGFTGDLFGTWNKHLTLRRLAGFDSFNILFDTRGVGRSFAFIPTRCCRANTNYRQIPPISQVMSTFKPGLGEIRNLILWCEI